MEWTARNLDSDNWLVIGPDDDDEYVVPKADAANEQLAIEFVRERQRQGDQRYL